MAAQGEAMPACASRTVVSEIKYISANNTALHTKNWKCEITLECTGPREFGKGVLS